MIKKIYITYGLPASGKSRWSKMKCDNTHRTFNCIRHIELDDHLYRWDSESRKAIINSDKEFKSLVKRSIEYNLKDRNSSGSEDGLVIDSLFTSNYSLIEVISMIKSSKYYKESIEIIIIKFDSDIETCIWNDKGRKDRFGNDKNTKASIKNMGLEKLNLKELKKIHENTEVTEVKVDKKPLIKNLLYRDNSDFIADKIESDTWDTGGTWQNCWNTGGNVKPEAPATIEIIKPLLESCGASHLYYDIIDELAEECGGDESDYYGGCRYYSWYELEIDKLENFLRDRGYLRNVLIDDVLCE